jgi:hypothetical protein
MTTCLWNQTLGSHLQKQEHIIFETNKMLPENPVAGPISCCDSEIRFKKNESSSFNEIEWQDNPVDPGQGSTSLHRHKPHNTGIMRIRP